MTDLYSVRVGADTTHEVFVGVSSPVDGPTRFDTRRELYPSIERSGTIENRGEAMDKRLLLPDHRNVCYSLFVVSILPGIERIVRLECLV